MISTSRLKRKADDKIFKVTFLSHWSTITAEDGEEDVVKWLGDNEYVSSSKGYRYILLDKDSHDF